MKIDKVCTYCNKNYSVLYKKRNSKFCSTRCAYDSRIKLRVKRNCAQCKIEFECQESSPQKLCSKKCAAEYYAENFVFSDESKQKMSQNRKNKVPWNKGLTALEDSRILSGELNPAFGKIYNTKDSNPQWAENISKSSIGKINLGDKNGMKKAEARAKVSATRKELFKDQSLRDKMAEKSKQAWKDGKFDGVKVGQCKWYDFLKANGELIKLQGTWELAFAKWADEQKIKFIAHKGRIDYLEGKIKRQYYPDFFVEDWNCWVDIKNDYHFNLQKNKFDNIMQSNPNLNLKILRKTDLISLGVKLK